MTDLELVKACKANNPKAQKILYQRYAEKLMGVCMRYGNSREDAEDIFQEAFVKVFHSIHKLKKVESLNAWVKRIVINTAINHYQKHKKHYGHIHEEFAYEINENNDHDYDKIIGYLDSKELLKVINQLSPGYRMVFNLYVIEGYSHKEIGKMLNITPNNSKSQLFKAKNNLKKMIQKLNLIDDERRA